jgi:hypothetical protein
MSVERHNDIIRFIGTFRPQHLGDLFLHFHAFLLGKPSQIVLDFSKCTGAFPNTMLPTIAMVSRFRLMNYSFAAILPTDTYLKDLFLSSNWAHFCHHSNIVSRMS